MVHQTTTSVLSYGLFTLGVTACLCFLRNQKQRRARDSIIYLDYNGTTPVAPVVVEAMVPYLQEHFGNPSSSHALGDVPRQAIERARIQILIHLLGVCVKDEKCDPASIVFTGCGTEADNLAIHFALQLGSAKKQLPHIVTTNVEHPAVDVYLQVQEQNGRCIVTRVPVQSNGCVTAVDMISAIQPNTYVNLLFDIFVIAW